MYHDLLPGAENFKTVFDTNIAAIEKEQEYYLQALISITGVLMNDQRREAGIVPYQKLTEFINFLCERSRHEC